MRYRELVFYLTGSLFSFSFVSTILFFAKPSNSKEYIEDLVVDECRKLLTNENIKKLQIMFPKSSKLRKIQSI